MVLRVGLYMQSLTWKVCVCLAPASEVVFEIVSYMFLTNLQYTFLSIFGSRDSLVTLQVGTVLPPSFAGSVFHVTCLFVRKR